MLFTNGAFSPTALVLFRFTSRFTCILDFIRLVTLEAFFVGETYGVDVFTATIDDTDDKEKRVKETGPDPTVV